MREIETFYRGEKIGVEDRSLPAHTYNSLKVLLDLSEKGCVFVPIRSMQFLSVIDQEEVIFVDGMSGRRKIEFSWQGFIPQSRTSLSDPVGYKFVYYDLRALKTMKRALIEFDKAVQSMYLKAKSERGTKTAEIVAFKKK